MGKSLVVVESPAKVKTIQKFLGRGYVVRATMGHVRDLPKSTLGVDEAKDFAPEYVVPAAKRKVVDELRKAAAGIETLYVATDPDREGEAIGWHVAEELAGGGGARSRGRGAKSKPSRRKLKVVRIRFNELTKRAVQEAFEHPSTIDRGKVDAQQARRVLDRVVGYSLSPLLWEKVQRGLSAGRVQSVAVRLVVDREREIQRFQPEEYWSLSARLDAGDGRTVVATLREVDGQAPRLGAATAVDAVVLHVQGARFVVGSVVRSERRRHPAPPFITSTLQQEAGRRLGFTARRTMMLAQQLYEGIELDEAGAVGLITYMRTDSVRIAREAAEAARTVIAARWGGEHLPDAPPVYRSRGSAQEAHEAIRPTDVTLHPGAVARRLTPDQLRLYRLVWERFFASQMRPAEFDTVTADIVAVSSATSRPEGAVFRARGETLRFAGFTTVYTEGREETEREEESTGALPPLAEGQALTLLGLDPKQHFTEPPPRFTEASLIKLLEEKGIGRPSTYAAILGTIVNDRGYVHRERRTLHPTELGIEVTDLLVPFFPELMDVDFTAQLEDHLDGVEEGDRRWPAVVRELYEPLQADLARARGEMRNVKVGAATGEACPECGSPLLERRGRFGKFLACSAYRKGEAGSCRYTRNLEGGERPADEPTGEACPECGRPLVLKRSRFGRFIGCSGYPECKVTRPMTLGIACPRSGCDGQLAERRSKRGRTFYGCTRWPDCSWVSWQRPVAEPCPKCGAGVLLERVARGVRRLSCGTEGCDFQREAREGADPAAREAAEPTAKPAGA